MGGDNGHLLFAAANRDEGTEPEAGHTLRRRLVGLGSPKPPLTINTLLSPPHPPSLPLLQKSCHPPPAYPPSRSTAQTPSASTRSPSTRLNSLPRCTASIHPLTARGAAAAITFASASPRAINSGAGTTSSTSPSRSASTAPTGSPVSIIFNAADCPTSRGNRCVPPYPGANPSFTSAVPV